MILIINWGSFCWKIYYVAVNDVLIEMNKNTHRIVWARILWINNRHSQNPRSARLWGDPGIGYTLIPLCLLLFVCQLLSCCSADIFYCPGLDLVLPVWPWQGSWRKMAAKRPPLKWGTDLSTHPEGPYWSRFLLEINTYYNIKIGNLSMS